MVQIAIEKARRKADPSAKQQDAAKATAKIIIEAALTTLPATCDAVVTIKIGEPQTDCRVVHGAPHHVSFLVDEGYAVLKERLKRLFLNNTVVSWPESAAIYVKATVNARQRDYQRLPDSDDAFKAFLSRLWAGRNRQDQRLSFFVYAPRVQRTNPIHRATAARMAQATRDIAELVLTESSEAVGPASLEYWATVQARQPDGAPITRPDDETFRKLNYIDTQAQRHQQEIAASAAAANSETRRIHVRLDSVAVPIDIDIQEVWRILGLPGYDLRPPYRDRVAPSTNDPADAADEDHIEEENAI